MIERHYGQRQIAEGFFSEPVEDWWEPWMKQADKILDDEDLINTVYEALQHRHPQSATRGRVGTPAEIVIRLMVLKHVRGWSYEILEREVRANMVYRMFTRIGAEKVPDAKTMGRLGQALGPEIVECVHKRLVGIACEKKVVRGRKLRVDTTVVETNIHYPTDSSLLGDGVRVLTRTMKKITKIAGAAETELRDRSRSVQLKLLEIARAARAKGGQSQEKLKSTYSKLLHATSRVVGQAKRFAEEIAAGVKQSRFLLKQMALEGLRQEIETMVPLVKQVTKQTRARIFRGDTRTPGKILSLFEPSTELIRKGKAAKPNEFGKMVKLQEAENQIVVDYAVYAQRPNDADLLIPAIETHRAKLGRTPYLVAADAGFYSAKKRGGCESQGRQTRVHPQSLNQEQRAQTRTEKALVSQRSEMADRMRGTHQRGQAAAWTEPLPLQRRGRYAAVHFCAGK